MHARLYLDALVSEVYGLAVPSYRANLAEYE